MQEFINYLRAKDGLIYTFSYEENEFIEDLCSAVKSMSDQKNNTGFKIPARIFVYTRTIGMYELDIINPLAYDPKRINKNIRNFNEAFAYIRSLQNQVAEKDDNLMRNLGKARNKSQEEEEAELQPAIFIFKDLHLYFNDKDILRNLRDLKESYISAKKNTYCPIIVTSPVLDLPPELEKIFTLFEYPMMTKDEIKDSFRNLFNKKNISDEEQEKIASCLTGLTKRECMRAVMHSMASHEDKKVRAEDLHEEKRQIVKKSGSLEFIVPQHTLEDMGGCDNFKTWVKKVKESMSDEAKAFGVPQPKGAMLVGVPGTSKTVSAEIMASYLGIPLLSLNIARVMGSFVGQSEHRILEALRIAKSVAPCVLLLDEMEKTLGGVHSSNQTDSGTLARVMAQLLNFLQEDDTGIITIMTSNDVSQLPPELTRSGRIDTQWMFDLPNEYERSEIIDIYAKKSNLNFDDVCHTYMVQATDHFTGAEIKSAVKEILVNVFYRQKNEGVKTFTRDVTIEDIKDAVKNVVTVYKSSKEKIENFKAYASDRYLNASKTPEELRKSVNTASVKSVTRKNSTAKKTRVISLED